MARPHKNNADYFSHDNDMRNDDKILSVRRKFWHEWYSVWNMLLEKLCKSTWFIIDVDNVSIELLSWDFVVEPEKLKEIIDYFVYIRLILREWDRIYSQKMIDRFEWLLSKRQRDIEYRQWKPKYEEVIDVDNTQSKVKESKVNNIIEEEIIEEETTPVGVPEKKKSIINKNNKIWAVQIYDKIKEMCIVVDWSLNDCVVLRSKLEKYGGDPVNLLEIMITKMRDTWLSKFYSISSPWKLADNLWTIVEKLKAETEKEKSKRRVF